MKATEPARRAMPGLTASREAPLLLEGLGLEVPEDAGVVALEAAVFVPAPVPVPVATCAPMPVETAAVIVCYLVENG